MASLPLLHLRNAIACSLGDMTPCKSPVLAPAASRHTLSTNVQLHTGSLATFILKPVGRCVELLLCCNAAASNATPVLTRRHHATPPPRAAGRHTLSTNVQLHTGHPHGILGPVGRYVELLLCGAVCCSVAASNTTTEGIREQLR